MRAADLLKLKDNWDSYGGKKPLPSCVAKAEELYFRLPGAWEFVPCSDSGVQLEQHINGFDIELRVSPAPVIRDQPTEWPKVWRDCVGSAEHE